MASDGQPTVASTLGSALTDNAKISQLKSHTTRIPEDGEVLKHAFGAGVSNTTDTLSAGRRGPASLEDPHAREKISHFDHERIPERVVHARGAGAHGHFKLHTSLADFTDAEILTNTSQSTPTFVRFSTVLGSRGAADTNREVHGFAVKFYTQQGNWDIVGNNIPIFFVQDGIQFPDLIHAGKPEPQLEIPQSQTAHDSFYDLLSLEPSSLAMSLWALSDRTIPRSYRHMAGHGVNTFVLTKNGGKDPKDRHFVKFHWRPQLGVHSLVWDEALKLAGQDPDFHRRDLADSINAGAYPKWDFGVQVIPWDQEHAFEYDLLDCTKLVPEEDVPIKWVGEMTLDRNPTEYFAEVEQVAFGTQHIVPGIDYSLDPMLTTRNFSYQDTQLIRLGGPNWHQLPINRPLCPFINTLRDGASNHLITSGPNYYPNRFSTKTAPLGVPRPAYTDKGERAIEYTPVEVSGVRERARGEKYKEYVNQAELFWNSMSPTEKDHIIAAASFELGRCVDPIVRERMVARFNEVDNTLASQVAVSLGIAPPKQSSRVKHNRISPALSQLSDKNIFGATGRRVGIVVFDGFDSATVKGLTAAIGGMGNIVNYISDRNGAVFPEGVTFGDKSAAGVVQPQFSLETCRSTFFDAIIIAPGGADQLEPKLNLGRTIFFAREAFAHFKPIAVIGPSAVSWFAHKVVPGSTDYDASLTAQSEKDGFTSKNGVVLARNLGKIDAGVWENIKELSRAPGFLKAFVDACTAHRHWGRDISGVAY